MLWYITCNYRDKDTGKLTPYAMLVEADDISMACAVGGNGPGLLGHAVTGDDGCYILAYPMSREEAAKTDPTTYGRVLTNAEDIESATGMSTYCGTSDEYEERFPDYDPNEGGLSFKEITSDPRIAESVARRDWYDGTGGASKG